MFDASTSHAYKRLVNIVSELKMDYEDPTGQEIGCSGIFEYKGKVNAFSANSVPEQFEETLDLAIKVFNDLEENVAKAQDLICKVYWPIYKEHWADDDIDITENEFMDKLTLITLNVWDRSRVGLDFCEAGLLGGHPLGAISLDKGQCFTEADM